MTHALTKRACRGHSRARRRLGLLLSGVGVMLSALGTTAFTQPAGRVSASESAVRAARARSNAAISARDTLTLISLVSPSYHAVSSRNAHTNGRDGVAAQWRAQFTAHPDVRYVRTPQTVRVYAPWQMAEERGAWVGQWSESDGAVVIRGSYTAKWRRVEGQWLLETEVFTPLACTGSSYCSTPP